MTNQVGQQVQGLCRDAGLQSSIERTAAGSAVLSAAEQQVVDDALQILGGALRRPGVVLSSPGIVREYVALKLGRLEHEEFHVLYLDAQLRLIEHVPMFRGTLNQTSVYPREVLRCALLVNALSVIVVHNHPSGSVSPSDADDRLTGDLKRALAVVAIGLLDHLVVAGTQTYSYANTGRLAGCG